MDKYVNQLLEDIEMAQQKAPVTKPVDKPFSIEEHFEEIERWLANDPEFSFGIHCGLQLEQFPPVNRLTEKQLELIYTAFRELLYSWNLDTDIPENFPLSQAYPLLISSLDEKVYIFRDGFMTIEFCTYDLPSCPFGEFCRCKDFKYEGTDETFEHPMEGDSDIPF